MTCGWPRGAQERQAQDKEKRARLAAAVKCGQRIIIDLDFAELMTDQVCADPNRREYMLATACSHAEPLPHSDGHWGSYHEASGARQSGMSEEVRLAHLPCIEHGRFPYPV